MTKRTRFPIEQEGDLLSQLPIFRIAEDDSQDTTVVIDGKDRVFAGDAFGYGRHRPRPKCIVDSNRETEFQPWETHS